MTSTESATTASANATVTPQPTAPEPIPDTGRPTPPDAVGGDSIHRPGMAPGMAILDGPAAMTVGAHRKQGKGKSGGKGGSSKG